MKTVLVVTGPQGSGNHLFSKLLSLHPAVFGWKDLLSDYWIAHEHEPFASCWEDPSRLDCFDWSVAVWYVTSVSCPYARASGVTCVPDYTHFFRKMEENNISYKLVIIGRDQTVLHYQQQRVRDTVTFDQFFEQLSLLSKYDPIFISQELVYLYKNYYLQSLSNTLKFPIDYQNPQIYNILKQDANAKYFFPIGQQDLDVIVRQVSTGVKPHCQSPSPSQSHTTDHRC